MAEKTAARTGPTAGGKAWGFVKATVGFVADTFVYGNFGQQGASEVANALYPNSGYGPAQQPKKVETPEANNHQGVIVPEPAQPSVQAEVAADPAPVEPQGSVHGPSDPLQKAAENARAYRESAQGKGQSRSLEIG